MAIYRTTPAGDIESIYQGKYICTVYRDKPKEHNRTDEEPCKVHVVVAVVQHRTVNFPLGQVRYEGQTRVGRQSK